MEWCGFAPAAASTQTNIRAGVDTLIGLIEAPPLQWLATDEIADDAEAWSAPAIDTDATAMVQYTSGSTRPPNGVVLAHSNLLHNLEVMRQAWHGDDDAVSVYWLPQHHDMGLIGGILEMVYVGATTHLMSPTTSSGKIQRGACRQQFIDHALNALNALAEWHAPLPPTPAGSVEEARLAQILRDAVVRKQRAAAAGSAEPADS